ncbi:MAG: phosphatidate cytidylyltransferase [Armatimonadetes bacterium]|nr:phosphatidate cytidylyltransferase [Armatimonadota bacterium]
MNSEQPTATMQAWPHGPTKFEQRHGNGKMRVVTAIAGIPIVLGALWIGGWAFFWLIAAATIGALIEFYWMAEKKGARPNKIIGVATVILLCFLYSQLIPVLISIFMNRAPFLEVLPHTIPFFVFLTPVLVLLLEMFRRTEGAMTNIGATIAGITYVGVSLPALIGIVSLEPLFWSAEKFSFYSIMAVLISIWTCDSFAYYGGRLFGKHKLFERVSPKKTWEGAICGVVGAVGAMLLIRALAAEWFSVADAIIMGIICGVFGQLGDLAESHLKRDAGVKDSSQLIPGHGGILDRFDSLLFVAPLIYLYLLLQAGIVWLR